MFVYDVRTWTFLIHFLGVFWLQRNKTNTLYMSFTFGHLYFHLIPTVPSSLLLRPSLTIIVELKKSIQFLCLNIRKFHIELFRQFFLEQLTVNNLSFGKYLLLTATTRKSSCSQGGLQLCAKRSFLEVRSFKPFTTQFLLFVQRNHVSAFSQVTRLHLTSEVPLPPSPAVIRTRCMC